MDRSKTSLLTLLTVVTLTFLLAVDSVSAADEKNILTVEIPEDLGNIIDSYEGTTDTWVIHIQDIHTHPEAQYHTAELLEHLHEDYGINLIASEGASGLVTPGIFAHFPRDDALREKIARIFVESGELTGEEYLAITKNPPITIWGVEDNSLYQKNLDSFQKGQQLRGEIVPVLDMFDQTFTSWQDVLYRGRLKDLEERFSQYQEGKLSVVDIAAYLKQEAQEDGVPYSSNFALFCRAAELEKAIDQKKINADVQFLIQKLTEKSKKEGRDDLFKNIIAKSIDLKEKRIKAIDYYPDLLRKALEENVLVSPQQESSHLISYVDYLEAADKIDHTGVLNEMEPLRESIANTLFTTDLQKELFYALNHVKTMRTLLELNMKTEEFEYYMAHREQCSLLYFKTLAERISMEMKLPNPLHTLDYDYETLDERRTDFEQFYHLATQRDRVLIQNALRQMTAQGVDRVVLISGGFHTHGFTKYFKENGISYLVIVPKVSVPVDLENYNFLISGKRKPISELIKELQQEEIE